MSKVQRIKLALAGALVACAPLTHAMVTIDVMAIPAGQIAANASTAAGAKVTSSAKANSEKEQTTAKTNSAKEIAQAIENTKKIMDQALFFAKQPIEWAKMVRDYATIAEGWPEPASSTSETPEVPLSAGDIRKAMEEALANYGAAQNPGGATTFANQVFQEDLQVRQNEMKQRSALIGEFNRLNTERAERMMRIEDMLNKAEYQRDFDMVTTLLSMEQIRFGSEQAALNLSRDALAENAAVKRQHMAAARQAEFTDMRLPDASGATSAAQPPRPIKRIGASQP